MAQEQSTRPARPAEPEQPAPEGASRPSSEQVRIVPKPWGEEWWLAHTDRYAGKVLFVRKGQRLSLQYHNVKHETQFMWSGRIRMEIGRDENHMEERILGPGAVTEIVPGTRHRIEALEDAYIFEISTPELDDVVRVSDDYGRQGTSKP
jgi:mannose-6-phosphate isomerase-like protein (cupin superfamily)